MAQITSSGGTIDDERPCEIVLREQPETQGMADLKVFWGPEICRLEYLVHLLDTGRIKDEHWSQRA